MSYKARAKSEGVADEGGSLMCSAHNCPNRWSVKIESPMCRYHAWEKPEDWPSITESLRRNGPWLLRNDKESPGVSEMKARMRKGGKLTAPELEWRTA
jgi:hypothetical protein